VHFRTRFGKDQRRSFSDTGGTTGNKHYFVSIGVGLSMPFRHDGKSAMELGHLRYLPAVEVLGKIDA
jgi:hypothetical protein